MNSPPKRRDAPHSRRFATSEAASPIAKCRFAHWRQPYLGLGMLTQPPKGLYVAQSCCARADAPPLVRHERGEETGGKKPAAFTPDPEHGPCGLISPGGLIARIFASFP